MLAIDGNSLVHRSFHSQAHTALRTADGRPSWAVRGLLSHLLAAVDRIDPDVVVVGFDDPRTSQRREKWPHYKAHRADKLDTLVEQLELAVDVLRTLGIAVVVPPGLEADDVLASASRLAPTVGACTVVMTSDRDAFSLIDDHTRVLRILNGGVEASPLLTAERLVMMLGVRPEQYRDLAALRGDPSDNLPGVRGIGTKTAAKLLIALGSAAAAFDDLDNGGERVTAAVGARAARALAEPAARSAWQHNCAVMRMHTDLALDLTGTAGALPLPAESVRAAFTGHQLLASAPIAMRVLARQEPTDADRAPAPPPRVWTTPPIWDRPPARPQRYPPLRKPKQRADPLAEQLALFD